MVAGGDVRLILSRAGVAIRRGTCEDGGGVIDEVGPSRLSSIGASKG